MFIVSEDKQPLASSHLCSCNFKDALKASGPISQQTSTTISTHKDAMTFWARMGANRNPAEFKC